MERSVNFGLGVAILTLILSGGLAHAANDALAISVDGKTTNYSLAELEKKLKPVTLSIDDPVITRRKPTTDSRSSTSSRSPDSIRTPRKTKSFSPRGTATPRIPRSKNSAPTARSSPSANTAPERPLSRKSIKARRRSRPLRITSFGTREKRSGIRFRGRISS